MRLGKIDNLVLFGGTQRLVNFITVARHSKFINLVVISGPRLLKSNLPNEKGTLRQYLERNKIKYFEIGDIHLFRIDNLINNHTLGISFGAPWIFSKDFVKKFKGKLINGHGMNLPRNRGGGGFSWQIMRGERNGCHLFHLIDTGIDTGNIIFLNKFKFPNRCRIPKDYEEFFRKTEINFFKKFLKKIKSNFDFKEVIQDESLSTYFPRLSTFHHGFINWNWKARDIERFICAFDLPYQGASTFLNRKRIFLRGVRTYSKDGHFHPFMNGLIYRKYKNILYVAVSDGAISINGVYDASGKDIFSKVKLGYRFVTALEFLYKALLSRIVYDAIGLRLNDSKENKARQKTCL